MQPLPRLIDAWLSACPRNVCPRAKNQCMVHRLPTLHPDSTSSLPGTCQQPETICRWRVWKPETLVDAMLVLLRCDLQYGVRSWLPLRAPYLSLYHIYLYLIYIIYISLSLTCVYLIYIYVYISLSLMCLSHIYIYVYIYHIYHIYPTIWDTQTCCSSHWSSSWPRWRKKLWVLLLNHLGEGFLQRLLARLGKGCYVRKLWLSFVHVSFCIIVDRQTRLKDKLMWLLC